MEAWRGLEWLGKINLEKNEVLASLMEHIMVKPNRERSRERLKQEGKMHNLNMSRVV